MTSPVTTETGGTALVVIDLQNAVMAESENSDAVITRIVTLIDRARRANTPIIFVTHEDEEMPAGSEGWQLVPQLVALDGDIFIPKRYPDAFAGTDLEDTLEDLGANHLVVCGAQTDACIRATVHRAASLGYRITLAADAHTTAGRTFDGVTLTVDHIVAQMNMSTLYLSYPQGTPAVLSHDDEIVFEPKPVDATAT